MVFYVAGPYRAPTVEGVAANIEAAKKVAIKYWKRGYTVLCPHMNTAHFDGICPDEVWLKGDIELMLKCDAVVMMENWRESSGAVNEHEIAKNHGVHIIYDDGA